MEVLTKGFTHFLHFYSPQLQCVFPGQVYVYVFFSTSAILSLLVASQLH